MLLKPSYLLVRLKQWQYDFQTYWRAMSMVNSVTINLWSLNNRRPLAKGKNGSPKVYSDQFKIGAHNPKVVGLNLISEYKTAGFSKASGFCF
jgi:hypothetical protein